MTELMFRQLPRLSAPTTTLVSIELPRCTQYIPYALLSRVQQCIAMLPISYIIVLLFFAFDLSYSQHRCFDRRGVEKPDLPCDPSASAGPCCAETYICLSNGLCALGPDTAKAGYILSTDFYQGTCTNATWTDSRCPRFCMSDADKPTSGQSLEACTAAGVGRYCCRRDDVDCCKNSSAIMDLGIAEIQTTIGASAHQTSTATILSTTAPAPATNSTSGVPQSSGSSTSSKVAIGIGVGAGFALVILLAVIAAVVLSRRGRFGRTRNDRDRDKRTKMELPSDDQIVLKEDGVCHELKSEEQFELEAERPVRELR